MYVVGLFVENGKWGGHGEWKKEKGAEGVKGRLSTRNTFFAERLSLPFSYISLSVLATSAPSKDAMERHGLCFVSKEQIVWCVQSNAASDFDCLPVEPFYTKFVF